MFNEDLLIIANKLAGNKYTETEIECMYNNLIYTYQNDIIEAKRYCSNKTVIDMFENIVKELVNKINTFEAEKEESKIKRQSTTNCTISSTLDNENVSEEYRVINTLYQVAINGQELFKINFFNQVSVVTSIIQADSKNEVLEIRPHMLNAYKVNKEKTYVTHYENDILYLAKKVEFTDKTPIKLLQMNKLENANLICTILNEYGK